jgi:succinate dehydrogenase / fumarate reductase flavoprotein subunit
MYPFLGMPGKSGTGPFTILRWVITDQIFSSIAEAVPVAIACSEDAAGMQPVDSREMSGKNTSYPETMMKSIKRLEETREKRIEQKIPLLGLSEREVLLKQFHPDYREGVKREIQVGANRGERIPNELADLFEGESMIDPDDFDLSKPKYEADVLVVGGGGGGATASIFAKENGAKVILATKLRLGDSNTIMAEGGIQAATSEYDSPALHYLDTMGGGGFHNHPELVRALAHDAPMILDWLTRLGVMFDRRPDGEYLTSFAGGQCRRRVHSAADYSGLEIMRVLRDELCAREIDILEFTAAIELVLDESGSCAGAIFLNLDTREQFLVKAKTVILATGGIGRIHIQNFPTTNHYGATADGLVIANRAGAKVVFVDATQFHPTGTAYPEQILGLLVSEAFRGWSGQLVNVEGERFINELETRDITSSAVIREVTKRKKGVEAPTGMVGVWLDTPLVDIIKGSGTINRIFPHLFHRFRTFGIDITQFPVLVYPTQHYQNGGIQIDVNGESTVRNLFVAGEASGGVHGRNRLGGNSLLDIFVFGRRAGITTALRSKETKIGKLTLQHVKEYHDALRKLGIQENLKSPLVLPDYRYERALTQVHQ